MKKARVVIGANYGDEGKGLMTDYFASQNPDKSLVIRFNGGAQAGHTVTTPSSDRHVFSHFGAGTFMNSPCFLSKHFIVNPMLFVKELKELKEKHGLNPVTYIDPRAIVSTPFDVFINQYLEISRGNGRHGSCGLGINETVTRCKRENKYRSTVNDLLTDDHNEIFDRLMILKDSWLRNRLKELNLNCEAQELFAFESKLERIIERYCQDVKVMLDHSKTSRLPPSKKELIFEGAQGLLLDEARIDKFPHLTRSRTGLTNVIDLAGELEIDELDVTYVSRTYLTKHGAGPLAGESDFSFKDPTNVTNQFQGSLRFAPLDIHELNYSINLDLAQAKHSFANINASIAITCADQLAPPPENLLPLPVSHLSFGPSRAQVKENYAMASKVTIPVPLKVS